MNRADSPTLREPGLRDFYEKSMQKRAEKIEAEFQKLDNYEFLKNQATGAPARENTPDYVRYYSDLFARQLLLVGKYREPAETQTGEYHHLRGRYSLRYYLDQGYCQEEVQMFANTVNFVESHLEVALKPLASLEFDQNAFNEDLKGFEIDQFSRLMLKVVSFIKYCLIQTNNQHLIKPIDINYKKYDTQFTEVFADRRGLPMRFPRYQALNKDILKMESDFNSDPRYKAFARTLADLNESISNVPVRGASQYEDGDVCLPEECDEVQSEPENKYDAMTFQQKH